MNKFKSTLEFKSRLPISKFSGYHCIRFQYRVIPSKDETVMKTWNSLMTITRLNFKNKQKYKWEHFFLDSWKPWYVTVVCYNRCFFRVNSLHNLITVLFIRYIYPVELTRISNCWERMKSRCLSTADFFSRIYLVADSISDEIHVNIHCWFLR